MHQLQLSDNPTRWRKNPPHHDPAKSRSPPGSPLDGGEDQTQPHDTRCNNGKTSVLLVLNRANRAKVWTRWSSNKQYQFVALWVVLRDQRHYISSRIRHEIASGHYLWEVALCDEQAFGVNLPSHKEEKRAKHLCQNMSSRCNTIKTAQQNDVIARNWGGLGTWLGYPAWQWRAVVSNDNRVG